MTDKYIHGVIDQSDINRKNDYLYRITVKALIMNDKGEVLVVKESGRTWWDLPGGGMDHGENIKSAIARELKEEINLGSDFDYTVIAVDNPTHLNHANVLQIRIIFQVLPKYMNFSEGVDADRIAFIDPESLRDSDSSVEKLIWDYVKKIPSK